MMHDQYERETARQMREAYEASGRATAEREAATHQLWVLRVAVAALLALHVARSFQ